MVPQLLDHFIGDRENAWRQSEAKRLGNLQIDDEFIFGGSLHRQVGGLLAFEDAIDVARSAPVWVGGVGAIEAQSAASYIDPERIDRRQAIASRESNDQLAMQTREPARRDDEAAVRVRRKST